MTTATVIPERLARFLDPEVHLCNGPGSGVNGSIDVCVMQAVAWLAGEVSISDTPECACPVIGRFAANLNDSRLFRDHRDLLKPYASRIVGTRAPTQIAINRGLIAADYAVRVFAPIRLRALGREEWARDLESLAPITDLELMRRAKDATSKIRDAADADSDADAYEVAYAVADDAYSVAGTYIYADAYADAFSYAAAAAAAAASADAEDVYVSTDVDVAVTLRLKALECLDAMLAVDC